MSASSDEDFAFEGEDTAAPPAWPEPEFALQLRKPVKVAGDDVDSILLREPTAAEWEEIFEKPAKIRRRWAVSRISGVPFTALAQVGIGDLILAEEYLNSFFEVGQVRGRLSAR